MNTKTVDVNNAQQVAEVLSKFVNNYSCNQEEFVQTITTEHRTLQQSMFGLMLKCIDAWAEMEKKDNYDLRNEQTVKMCKDIKELLEKKYYKLVVPMV